MIGRMTETINASFQNVKNKTIKITIMDKPAQTKSTIPHEIMRDNFLASEVILAMIQP